MLNECEICFFGAPELLLKSSRGASTWDCTLVSSVFQNYCKEEHLGILLYDLVYDAVILKIMIGKEKELYPLALQGQD